MKHSAGIIPYRMNNGKYEFFVGHPGGPRWSERTYWAMLKGRIEEGEDEMTAALREFQEESGVAIPENLKDKIFKLGTVIQNPKKLVTAFAVEFPDIYPERCRSNMADHCDWPEIDNYAWIDYESILKYTHPTNIVFFETIVKMCQPKEY